VEKIKRTKKMKDRCGHEKARSDVRALVVGSSYYCRVQGC